MSDAHPRRQFLWRAGSVGALLGLADQAFSGPSRSRLSRRRLNSTHRKVRYGDDIEPLVRLLEETPRERVLEEVAGRIKQGLAYKQILAALLLAGVRSIQPRPVGFKFHAVLVVNSAHLASLASPPEHRWLPIFWAIDAFKSSQAENVKQGNWAMGPVEERAVPGQARQSDRCARPPRSDDWDRPESAADVAAAGLARAATRQQKKAFENSSAATECEIFAISAA